MEKKGYFKFYILSSINFILTSGLFAYVIFFQSIDKIGIIILTLIFFLFTLPPILMVIRPKFLGSLINRIYHLFILSLFILTLPIGIMSDARNPRLLLPLLITIIIDVYLFIFFMELRSIYFIINYERMQLFGEKALKNNDFSKALRYLKKSIKFNNENADSYKLRGMVYEKTNRFNKAFNDYEKALELYEKSNDNESVREVKVLIKKLPENSGGVMI